MSYVNVVSQNIFCTVLTFALTGSTLQFLFGISKLPASLLLHFGAIKYNKSYPTLPTLPQILQHFV